MLEAIAQPNAPLLWPLTFLIATALADSLSMRWGGSSARCESARVDRRSRSDLSLAYGTQTFATSWRTSGILLADIGTVAFALQQSSQPPQAADRRW